MKMKHTMQINNEHPIGIFDSGLGGLTVLQNLKKYLPNENYIYFGDIAHVPYGSKSNQNIIAYSKNIVEFLLSQNVKAIIIACNSASSVAFETIKNITDIPVFEVITPSVIDAIEHTKTKHVGVIGTSTTIESNIYKKKIKDLNPAISTSQMACPLFAPIIEEGLENTDIARAIVKLYLEPIITNNLDTIILGCTHYPIISQMLKTILPHNITLISSGKPLAQSLRTYLMKRDKLNQQSKSKIDFYVSDSHEKFKKLGSRFLGDDINNIHIQTL